MMLNIRRTLPAVQFAIAIMPTGWHTRISSPATRSGRGANIAPIETDHRVGFGIEIKGFGVAFLEREGLLYPMGRNLAAGENCDWGGARLNRYH